MPSPSVSRASGSSIRPLSPIVRTLRQRPLVVALTRRELTARYRGGVLGFFWSLANPLLLLAVYATVFRFVFTPRADVRPYAVFLFGGVLVWGFISASLLDAAETFRANGPLLRKTTVAPEVFPAVAVGARLVHLVLGVPILLLAIAVAAASGSFGSAGSIAGSGSIGGWALLQLPLVLFLLAAAILGLALAVSALSVHFGDVRDLVGNLLTLAFFLTPVLYPAASVPERFRPFLWANPFASFLAGVHESAFFFRPISPVLWAAMAATALVCLLAGGFVFDRLRDSIAEEA